MQLFMRLKDKKTGVKPVKSIMPGYLLKKLTPYIKFILRRSKPLDGL